MNHPTPTPPPVPEGQPWPTHQPRSRGRGAEGMAFTPQVHEAELSRATIELARDLYRAMDESVSDHLARLRPDRRIQVFVYAAEQVEQDVEAGRRIGVLRAFTEALLLLETANTVDDAPEEGPETLTPEEQELRKRILDPDD